MREFNVWRTSVSVVVGTGGGTYYSGRAILVALLFGSFCSATGGDGANQSFQHAGGLGGLGAGGDVNMYGGGGTAHGRVNGTGGSHSWWFAARGHPRGGDYSRNRRVDPLLDLVVLTDGSVPTRPEGKMVR